MALACLACHSLDSSTDSFRMDSFRMQSLSNRSSSSDEARVGCGRVSSCFPRPTGTQATKPSAASSATTHRRRSLVHHDGPSLAPPSSGSGFQRSGNGGTSLTSFGRQQQPDASSMDSGGFPEPRLTRCHAVRRDLFRNFSVGDSDFEFQPRRCCFNMIGTTA